MATATASYYDHPDAAVVNSHACPQRQTTADVQLQRSVTEPQFCVDISDPCRPYAPSDIPPVGCKEFQMAQQDDKGRAFRAVRQNCNTLITADTT